MEELAYEVVDVDNNTTIHTCAGWTRDGLAKRITYDFESADWKNEYGNTVRDMAQVEHDLEFFDVTKVVNSLKAFDFANGMCRWHCTLPGRHYEIVVFVECCEAVPF